MEGRKDKQQTCTDVAHNRSTSPGPAAVQRPTQLTIAWTCSNQATTTAAMLAPARGIPHSRKPHGSEIKISVRLESLTTTALRPAQIRHRETYAPTSVGHRGRCWLCQPLSVRTHIINNIVQVTGGRRVRRVRSGPTA